MNADRSSGERIRRLKALAAANGPAAKSRDYDTWQAVQFGKTPYLRLSATGAVVEENCCSGSGSNPDQYCAWNPANVRNFNPLFGGVAYGNDRWITVGLTSNGKNIQYSNDGINWQESSGTPFGNRGFGGTGVAYGNKQWVAVGGSSNGKHILYSTDNGLTWLESKGTPFGSGNGFGVAYGNKQWVAVGASSSGTNILYSTDNGLTWLESKGTPFGIGGFGVGVAYGNDKWVAVGFNPNGTNILYSTDNGLTWLESKGTPFGSGNGFGVAYGNKQWVAVGFNPNGKNILHSSDGVNWKESSGTLFGGKPGRGIVYANNLWVAVTGYPFPSGPGGGGGIGFPPGPNIIYSTDNGLTWQESPGKNFYGKNSLASGIAYGNNLWVATGASTNSATSFDPVTILYTSDLTAAC